MLDLSPAIRWDSPPQRFLPLWAPGISAKTVGRRSNRRRGVHGRQLRRPGQRARRRWNCLQKIPDINLVYTIRTGRRRAYKALRPWAGKERDDRFGRRRLAACATSRPASSRRPRSSSLNMAAWASKAGVEYARTGRRPAATSTPASPDHRQQQSGIESSDTAFGLNSCWGNKIHAGGHVSARLSALPARGRLRVAFFPS